MKNLAVTVIIAGLFGTLTAVIGYLAGFFIALEMSQEEPGLFNGFMRVRFGKKAKVVG